MQFVSAVRSFLTKTVTGVAVTAQPNHLLYALGHTRTCFYFCLPTVNLRSRWTNTDLKKKLKTERKTVFPWGMFHWGCYFYGGGAKWNHETDGSRRAQARAGMEENQYGNISGCTYQGLTSFRGHRGAATFKWGIQLWNMDLALAMVGIWLKLIGYTVGGGVRGANREKILNNSL